MTLSIIDRVGGTLLVDEADNLGLRENGILRGVLNSGHRKGGNIRRVIKGAPKAFNTFAPMAIAAIGFLPMPLMRRSSPRSRRFAETRRASRTDG